VFGFCCLGSSFEMKSLFDFKILSIVLIVLLNRLTESNGASLVSNGTAPRVNHNSNMDHSKIDHSKMDHGKIDNSKTDHSNMDHSNMDHSNMDHSIMDHSKMDHSNMDHGSAHENTQKENENADHEDNHKESHKGNHGGHHVPIPSFQLQLHTVKYKPNSFIMFTYPDGTNKVIVGFNYTTVDHYDRYIMRIRFHGQEEYATMKMKLFKNESNQLLLKGFLNAQYVVCVTLLSSSGLPEHVPLSTSDMCIDVVVGESHPIGGHHSTTGLLSPLLVAVAAVILLIITIGSYVKRAFLNHMKKVEEAEELREKYGEQYKASKATEKIKQEFSSVLLNKATFLKMQGASRICEIVENDSNFNLKNESNSVLPKQQHEQINYHVNKSLNLEHDMNFSHNQTSLNSLSHVLDDKPWTSRSNLAGSNPNKKPVFYFSE